MVAHLAFERSDKNPVSDRLGFGAGYFFMLLMMSRAMVRLVLGLKRWGE
jgi:hypothetical protein